MYDVIVIGGGPAGLMAAIAAGEKKANVLLVDKGNKLGRKLAISGGGRCNVTNRRPIEEVIRHIPGNGRFLYSAFSIFNNEDIITFFEQLGVQLKEEDHGRMFPVSDNAQSVVNALLRRLNELKVEIRTNSPVKDILFETDKHTIVLADGSTIDGRAIVIATGGKSVPHTGSPVRIVDIIHYLNDVYNTIVEIKKHTLFRVCLKFYSNNILSILNLHIDYIIKFYPLHIPVFIFETDLFSNRI